MSTRVVDQVDSWDDRSFGGGYRELQNLADGEFSGVVRAGGAELYMTRGVVVGVERGDIGDFQSDGTIYQAPTDALPLLAVMQQRSDEVRAKYYTEDTSISKVDKTLSDGGFTGYIELSENVLSGDYYLVYHAGTSMSVAYVGESSRLLDGDEAFETADDEVGIYEVRPVDIDPIDIPEPDDDAAGGGAADDEPATEAEAQEPSEPEPDAAGDAGTEPPAEDAATATTEAAAESEPAADSAPRQADAADRSATESTAGAAERDTAHTEHPESTPAASQTQQRRDSQPARQDRTRENRTEQADSGTQRNTTASRQPSAEQTQPNERRTGNGVSGAGQAGRARQSAQEPGADRRAQHTEQTSRQDAETKAIPSLDPDQTAVPDAAGNSQSTTSTGVSEPATDPDPTPESTPEAREPTPQQTEPRQQAPDPEPASQERAEPAEPAPAPEPEPASGVDPERVAELEADLSEKDEEIDRLEAELGSVTDERDDLEAELETLREERDELHGEVEELRDELQRLEEELGAATNAERRLTADEALAGTDIFVRYRSKGQATLEKAHGGSTRKEEVNENLRLEKHTQFDAETVAVGGQSYHEFLESTLEYQFVRWVVRELLFEIRDTGHQKTLADLYDVLPRIDRAELSGVIAVTYTEDGQETQSQEGFDVVLRDRMGNPLLAANLNDTREATTESMMERLITSAERVGQSSGGFSGAFLVTESFFDPGALETASDATQGGLLSRDKRKSFVNLSRKRGYHLCLVEARNENFHLAVPEL